MCCAAVRRLFAHLLSQLAQRSTERAPRTLAAKPYTLTLSRRAKSLTHIETMPSTSLNCFTPLPVALLLGGVSPAAGQNNVFANRADLLTKALPLEAFRRHCDALMHRIRCSMHGMTLSLRLRCRRGG